MSIDYKKLNAAQKKAAEKVYTQAFEAAFFEEIHRQATREAKKAAKEVEKSGELKKIVSAWVKKSTKEIVDKILREEWFCL